MAKKVIFTTPKGVAVYPWLTKADTKFKADGEYRTKLRLSGEDAEGLIKMIDEACVASLESSKAEIIEKATSKKDEKAKLAKCVPSDKPYKMVEDDDGNETGEVEFNFKMSAKVTPKTGDPFTQKPKIFDAKGQPIKGGVVVGGGSVIKVAFQVIPFFTALIGAGVSLRLSAVQVIELSAGGNAESYGFGEEEGYEADESSEEESVDCSDEGGDF